MQASHIARGGSVAQFFSPSPPRPSLAADPRSSIDGAAIRPARGEACAGGEEKRRADEAAQLGTGSRDEASERHCPLWLAWLRGSGRR